MLLMQLKSNCKLNVIHKHLDPYLFPLLLTQFTEQKVNVNTEGICFID